MAYLTPRSLFLLDLLTSQVTYCLASLKQQFSKSIDTPLKPSLQRRWLYLKTISQRPELALPSSADISKKHVHIRHGSFCSNSSPDVK